MKNRITIASVRGRCEDCLNLAIIRERNINFIDQIRLKLADFGLAKQMERNEKLEQACGTPGYMAPEVLANKSYDSKADIWSLGIILYECFTGELPFSMGAIMLMAMGKDER